MIIGTDGGEIKLFQLSSDYLSARCFASFKEPEYISSNSGIITFSIIVIAVHPLDPSIIAVRVKPNCVKVFKWSLNPPEIVLLAERNIGRNQIKSISFSTNSSLLVGCINGKNIVL
jgi:WD40 repeat protein